MRRSASGDGVPLVLLAGVLGHGLHRHPVAVALARDRAVYAPDTIGAAGRSVQTAPLRGVADYAAWFAGVLAELLPGAEVEVYPGMGHGVRGQIPDQVTARIVEFLARHDAD